MDALVIASHAAVLGLFLYAAINDIRTRTIPNAVNAAIACTGIVAWLLGIDLPFGAGVSFGSRVLGALACGGPFLAATLLGAQVGAGDGKLLAAAGCVLGLPLGMAGLALGVLAAGLWALYLRFVKKLPGDATFALGPFLAAGMALALTAGPSTLASLL